jgi:hypothetical protein
MLSSSWRARLAWTAALAFAGTCLFACYLLQAGTDGVDSDAASVALQAQDMLHGNLLLHGWLVADVAFYTTELPEYALVEALRGLRPDDVRVCAALTYTLLVLVTALVARGPARGREGIARALLAGGIMVAPEFGGGTNTLLGSPDHTGTGVPVMAILLLIDRVKPRWYVPPAVLVLLAWVIMADSLAIIVAAAPIAAVCIVRAAFRLARRREEAERVWYDLALAGAAMAAVPLAQAALVAIHAHGGFHVHPLPGQTFASASALPHQLRVVGLCVLILFGADMVGQPPGLMVAIAILHIAGLFLACLGLLAGIWRFFGQLTSRENRIPQILVAGTLALLAAGWLGTHVASGFDAHEIAIVLPFAAALAGRMLGGWATRPWLAPGLAIILAGYLAALGIACTQPTAEIANQPLADWLVAHHLDHGLAGYWQANSVDLDSGRQVTLAPIFGGSPYVWEAETSWYDPRVSYANFVVSVSSPPAESVFTRPAVMLRVFGRPAETYHFGRYIIMVWHQNLLTKLGSVPGAG